MTAVASATPPLRGALDLGFEADPEGRTVLRGAFRTGLFHISKPYWDGRLLVVQVINPTAGIFEGDRLESRCHVADGARACLIAPSSTQVYAMPGGKPATIRQTFEVAGCGALATLPRWTVLHRGARLHQSTSISIEPGAALFHAELVSAGRSRTGEFLAFDEFASATEIRVGGRLVLRERLDCGAGRNEWAWRMGGRPCGYLATVCIHFPDAGRLCEASLPAALSPRPQSLHAGFSVLTPDLVSVRLLAEGASGILSVLRRIAATLADHVPVSHVFSRIG